MTEYKKTVSSEPIAIKAESPEGLNLSRRRFSRAGVGVPVSMTLASKSAFGRNCLSNMLSGNLSDPDRGQCSKGWSPGGWGQPGGQVGVMSTLTAWSLAGYSFGHLILGKNPNKASSYTGGTALSAMAFITRPSGAPSGVTIREVINNYPSSEACHLATAYLNATLSQNSPSTFKYILTPAQVISLASRATPLPNGYANLEAFLNSTWT